ncbi:hypothetical protein vseg_015572 [Gypsophila vaccaria]
MADYEVVDPKKDLEDSFRPKCAKPYLRTRLVLRGSKVMKQGACTAQANTLITGNALIIMLLQSCLKN